MIEDPQIVRTTAQHTALLELKVPGSEIQRLMGAGLAEVRAAVAGQGIPISGPWFTHHFERPGEFFHLEIGVPVASPIVDHGRVRRGEWPTVRAARTVYQGTYEKLGEAWGRLDSWISAQGLTPAPDLWERYVVDPGVNHDPGSWRTELTRPLAD